MRHLYSPARGLMAWMHWPPAARRARRTRIFGLPLAPLEPTALQWPPLGKAGPGRPVGAFLGLPATWVAAPTFGRPAPVQAHLFRCPRLLIGPPVCPLVVRVANFYIPLRPLPACFPAGWVYGAFVKGGNEPRSNEANENGNEYGYPVMRLDV